MHSDIKSISKHKDILIEYDTYWIVSILEWNIIGGEYFFWGFCFGKIALSPLLFVE